MTDEMTPMLKVCLIDLLSRGGVILRKDFKDPDYGDAKRNQLIKLGLISTQDVKDAITNRKNMEISITDEGWTYLNDNLDFPIASGSKSVPKIFSRLLLKLSKTIQSNKTTIKNLIVPEPKQTFTSENLLNHINNLNKNQRSMFMSGGGLKIHTLWKSLDGLSLDTVHKLLLELQRNDYLVLYRFDDPGMVTAEDKEATLYIAGEPRHYLILKSRY